MQSIVPLENIPNLLAAFAKINHYFPSFIKELPCDVTNPRDFCIRCLLEMIRGTSKNVHSFLAPESLKDAQILLRTQIERFIKLKKACDDPLFAKNYIEETEKSRLKFVRIAVNDEPEAKGNPLYDSLKKVVNREMLETLDAAVKENVQEKSIWLLAKETGLLHEYYLPYRFYSEPTHAAAAELDDCFIMENDNPIFIPYGSRKIEELPPTIMLAMHITLEAASIAAQYKGINITQKLQELRIVHNEEPTTFVKNQ